MALSLDPTPSGVAANSFISLSDAQAIIDATPNSSAWGTDAAAQTQALVYATTLLNVIEYQGIKSSFTQALAWPRYGVYDPDYGQSRLGPEAYTVAGQWGFYLDNTTVPTRMKRACVMLALEILKAGTTNIWDVDKTANIAKKTIDVIATEYVAVSDRRFGLRVYPSVWREIYPLTMASQPTSVERA